MYLANSLCKFNGVSCIGCCGHTFKSKKEIERDLKKNTNDFRKFRKLEKFRDRVPRHRLRASGICYNLILKPKKSEAFLGPKNPKDFLGNSNIICPLHPAVCGRELRKDHCDKDFLCKSAKKFHGWSDEKRKKFLKFLKDKNLDWYDYSIGMEDNRFLDEFEKEK